MKQAKSITFLPRITRQKMIEIFLIVLTVLLVMGQFEKIQVTESIAIYLHDVWLALFVTWTALTNFTLIKNVVGKAREYKLELFFLLWVVIGLVGHLLKDHSISPFLYTVRILLYLTSIPIIYHSVKDSLHLREVTQWCTWAVGIGIAWFGWVQYLFFPDTRVLWFLGWDEHYYRLISTMLDPGFTGILLVMSFLFMQSEVWFAFIHTSERNLRILKHVLSVMILGAVLLTYSRASYLALAGSILLVCIASLQKKLSKKYLINAVVYALMFACVIPFLPHPGGEGVNLARTSTINARLETSQSGVTDLKNEEWGLGKGLFAARTSDLPLMHELPYHAVIQENWLIFLFSGTGFVGTTLALALLTKYSMLLWKRSSWGVSILAAVLIHGIFHTTLTYPFVVLFGGMIGVVYGLALRERKATQ